MKMSLSCDTSVVLGSATSDGSTIFAKNSDRSPNECQPLTHVARSEHRNGATLRCQYIDIPQVTPTWEVIGSRPYWLWGFEMGINEWGVAIGNEAVYTREPDEALALIGMDLVRLGLERGKTAGESVAVIGELIEEFGQGGSCEADAHRTYQNSFIVADPTSAWVVETAGHRWVASEVDRRASISNMLNIDDWDLGSDGVWEHALAQGWPGDGQSFAAAYADPSVDLAPRICRLERARNILASKAEPADVQSMMGLLSDHAERGMPTGPESLPTLCMHANPAFNGETAASMVAQLRPGRHQLLTTTAWTAFGSPCLSVYRPVYPFAVGLPAALDRGGCRYDADSPWWVFERLQRMGAREPAIAGEIALEFTKLQAEFFGITADGEAQAELLVEIGRIDEAKARLRAVVDETSARAVRVARDLTDRVVSKPASGAMADFWDEVDRVAGVTAIRPATVSM